MVRVAYIKNEKAYYDMKFVGNGLIQDFIHESNDFENKENQNKLSNYIVADARNF